ncbi:hypothetical protein ONS95_011591 [Cadophora gregata]|uniref:uncharacterized protein n=1 Tax=Cadophora gregata TaxID=51156 RepID=UPI0026DC1158|nr:uncharacterized protein ONS95_011591 [Cadophora gregata]KAK0120185.1 hypothetical protein ONS95_011591 [Cadophora gregata]KAK0121215.1 hypothetical protein ONS96_011392 [Cadophora gregata f. sp. sojae]
MAEQMGTPGSTADLSVNGSKTGAPKDKSCPFCHQQFTSSSLGRHLDLYIKEKNPKPADGVHDVDEIKKLRGGITRRQPRNSTSRREDSTPAGTPVAQDRRSPRPESDGQGNRSPSLRRDEGAGDMVNFKGKPSFFINKGTWENTGVMNNIPPPRTSDSRSWDGDERDANRRLEPRSRSVSKQMLAKTTFEQKQKMLDALDNAKAAELALRELMGSIRAAKQRIDGPSIFDYDPLTLDFPALTLRCLPPPPTLFQSTPIPSATSWSILPPDETQYHALVEHFSSAFHSWHVSVAIANTAPTEDLSYPPPEMFAGHEDPTEIAQRAEAAASELEAKVSQHLHNVFTHWNSLPQAKRSEIWTLELARGLGRKSEEIDTLKKERDFHKQETAHLKQQVDELSRLQHPREFKLQPPSTIPFEQPLMRVLGDQGLHTLSKGFELTDRHVHLDVLVERVIGRWKGIVREARGNGIGNGLSAQRSLSGGSSHSASLPPQPPVQQQQQQQTPTQNQNQNQNHSQPQVQTQSQPQPPLQVQTQQSQPTPTITTPQPTPTIAMDSSNLISPSNNDMDGMGSDADADADADMEDDESYVDMNMSTADSVSQPSGSAGFRLSSNGNGDRGMSTGMEGLENSVVQGYVRIGA